MLKMSKSTVREESVNCITTKLLRNTTVETGETEVANDNYTRSAITTSTNISTTIITCTATAATSISNGGFSIRVRSNYPCSNTTVATNTTTSNATSRTTD